MRTSIKLLDCTLRESGYLNNWQFSLEEVQSYLDSLKNFDVDIVEIGFRYGYYDSELGICAYSPDKFIEKLDIPENLQLSVMIKAEQFENPDNLKTIFTEKKNSRIDIVRIALPLTKADNFARNAEIIKKKGYKTFFNLTKIPTGAAIKLNGNELADVLYFADTYGAFSTEEVRSIAETLKSQHKGPLGFHGHGEAKTALHNALAAIESGISHIDSTINGTGKGFGNLKTENIVKEVKNDAKRLCIL